MIKGVGNDTMEIVQQKILIYGININKILA